jgi:biopolymer transport protein ExbD
MSTAPQQYLDVWIVESNTVYREVPFTVVCDWVQQGRLLEDDNVRRSGTADWKRIGGVPAFSAFLPKAEPNRADDQAEALDRVEFEFGWHKKHGEHEDDEVDMIPLIDVSLVLLIFFMLTSSSGGAGSLVKLAGVKNPPVADTTGISIVMNVENKDGKRSLVYTLGEDGKKSPHPDDQNIRDPKVLLRRLDERLKTKSDAVPVTINPHEDVEDGELIKVIRDVKSLPNKRKVGRIYNGVSEAKP